MLQEFPNDILLYNVLVFSEHEANLLVKSILFDAANFLENVLCKVLNITKAY